MNKGTMLIENLLVNRGGGPAVDVPSLEVREGEIISIVGLNGSGKTTLAMTVAGLVRAERGSIRSERGKDSFHIGSLPAWMRVRRGIRLVPAERPVFDELTVRENLAVAIQGGEGRHGTSMLPETLALDAFPILVGKQGQLAGTLSGGERRILALAGAYLAYHARLSGGIDQVRLLILDEPTFGLSPASLRLVGAAIRSLCALKVGVLVLEQNVAFATEVSDRVIYMAGGKLLTSPGGGYAAESCDGARRNE